MRSMAFLAALAFAPAVGAGSGDHTGGHPAQRADKRLVERGKYLVKIAGCNDCHTAGYAPNAGKVPESQWLMGDTLGWRGPWGTTYPVNLRLYMRDMTEANWVKTAKALRSRPPMPWFALNDMTEQDLRAISVRPHADAGWKRSAG